MTQHERELMQQLHDELSDYLARIAYSSAQVLFFTGYYRSDDPDYDNIPISTPVQRGVLLDRKHPEFTRFHLALFDIQYATQH